ncbi:MULTISPECIES: phosphoribosylglycinamide formyltransferase [Deefgea]|uniref:Phosphoribosylglycinamide formyltransferase n=1 Tax=Deefgea chitinilytica TaxID=570276 RepID=A0ABS2C7M3_9NEIS|nr:MULTISPECIES: phosphoribosylglycinamide formyltransferase [Deefgea]MBM5570037.1 phosphoribosylglycinamide formyltransferase [Deefgea chitinilytica]MBM9887266.1 phosphoribosylglycinamide formyltransferase [Deefgea sp. CFH1-16]
MQKNIVILISGRGSNMQSIVNAQIAGANIAAVISNRPDAAGLAWAAERGIRTAVLDHKQFADRAAFDVALAKLIDGYTPDLVVLAGFMRILTADFVNHYVNRLINVHPSLLPAFIGVNTHQRAIDEGVKLAGCTVHFVTAELDSGPIIAQAAVPVMLDDTAETLAQRILVQEHQLYPKVVQWFVAGQLSVVGKQVRVTAPASAAGFLQAPSC